MIVVLVIAVVGLIGGLIFALTRTAAKTNEEKEYLAVYEHLMHRYPELKCESENGEQITVV